jgi:hypothetical protein
MEALPLRIPAPWLFRLQANALVSPKSLEVIIQIDNYPYADNSNHLALVVASCSGTGTTSASSFVTGTGLSRMYLYVSSGARINGNLQQVNVEAWTTVDSNAYDTLIGNPTLKTMLQAKFNNNFSCQGSCRSPRSLEMVS